MTEVEKAYLAGIFDGEGCVMLSKPSNTNMRLPRVNISQKNQLDFLYELKNSYGGSVEPINGAHRWHITKIEEVQKFLGDILPYIRFKRDKALIALAICHITSLPGYKLTEDQKLQRLYLQDKFESQKLTDRGIQ